MRAAFAILLAAITVGAAIPGRVVARAQDATAPGVGEHPTFSTWLEGFRADAVRHGITPALLDRALADLQPLERVLEEDRQQAEFILPFDAYIARTLTPATIRQAREARVEHGELLDRVKRAYGVPPGIVVAIWGLESRFGRNTGRTPTVQALATLAWNSSRAGFFRGELLDALRVVDAGSIELDRLKGSWAGAMGQPQFMPSSYLAYAEDFDGDGRRDIWASAADVFASIANYLSKNGWQSGLEWGREVAVTTGQLRRLRRQVPYRSTGCYAMRNTTEERPVADWRRFGVRRRSGQPLPTDAGALSLVTAGTRSFLVTPNYFAILRYNCAHHYALSVALLSADSVEPPRTAAPQERKSPTHARRTRRR